MPVHDGMRRDIMSKINGFSHEMGSALMGVAVVSLLIIYSFQVQAAGQVNTGYFGNVAIKGYDPVAYFTEKRAVKGNKQFAYKWLGASWYFSSADHRQKFAQSPVAYAPQYGGYCSIGMSLGQVSGDVDPEAWTIINGKLYLNYSKAAAHQFFNEDTIKAADSKWQEMQ